MQTLIHNAILVLPDRLIDGGWLLIEDGRILDLGEEATHPEVASHAVDARSQFLLPGLIDLHCDAIEKLVEPRPNIHFDMRVALAEADWRLAGSGITTEFHATSLDDNEFAIRSETFLQDLFQAVVSTQEETLVRHKIHARLELTSHKGCEAMTRSIKQRVCQMISLMDHSPGQGQFRTDRAFHDYVAHTTHRSHAEIETLVEMKRRQTSEIPRRIKHITQLASEAGIAIATHDDDTAAKVKQWSTFGITISEFPTTLEAARQAHELGRAVCMGAPNVLRGRSSGGNLSALEAIRAGVASVLCSDYYPSAMLNAVFLLATKGVLTLPQAVRMVTYHPAQAVGLGAEYGSLERGKVADLVLMKVNSQGTPIVQRLWVRGEERLSRANSSSLG